MNEIFSKTELVMVLRLFISCICGIIIGFERNKRAKGAGMRTHCIVACSSALMMIVSKYGFFDMIDGSFPGVDIRLDPSRMAQGIVTGVGFLGAGVIYIQRGTIRGLTTAAGLWATAGIGMTIGAGEYFIGIVATLFILLIQVILHINSPFNVHYHIKTLKIYGTDGEGVQQEIEEKLNEMHVSVSDVSIYRNGDNKLDYSFLIEIPYGISEETIVRLFDQQCKIEFAH